MANTIFRQRCSPRTPKKLDSSLVTNRPKRICRLPSKFEEYSISPSKFVPVHPCHASTPTTQTNAKTRSKNDQNKNNKVCANTNRPKRKCRIPSKLEDHSIIPSEFVPVRPCHSSTPIVQTNTKSQSRIKNVQTKNTEIVSAKTNTVSKSKHKPKLNGLKKTKSTKNDTKVSSSNSSEDKSSLDTNNNGKKRTTRAMQATVQTNLHSKQVSPRANKITPFAKRLLDKSLSFIVLEDTKDKKGNGKNLDVYEFTFDPNEEPPPQKKKRKRTVRKKPAKPKTVIFKSNYDDNVSKALTSLKNKIKPSQPTPVQNNDKLTANKVEPTAIAKEQSTQAKPVTVKIPQCDNYSVNITPDMPPVNETARTSIHESNYASIRVEDIAADFGLHDDHNDINYSPVSSPHCAATPEVRQINNIITNPVLNTDPLNLQEDLSFFDDNPVASSSMNVSVRHPLASPWRVEFGSLPVKWHSDTYVKPNMTPAVESSFICSEGMNKKKHVYTNIVPENEPLPEIDSNPANLKQPSIISFMKEVAERSALKRKRKRSVTPNRIFDNAKTPDDVGNATPKKAKKTKDSTPNSSEHSNDRSNDKENSNQSSNKSISPDKAQNKKNKDCTYFGFDDSENLDQENITPVKVIPKMQTRGLKSRAVLRDLNAQNVLAGPTRAVMPVAAKAKLTSSEVADQLYDKLKSTEDAQFPGKETAKEPGDDTVVTNVDDPSWQEEDDSQSVHLFEDIEVVHHLKPHRKSYGKAKKVTFQQQLSNSDSDSQLPAQTNPVYSSDDDLADLTFQIPNVKEKKVVKKKKPKKKQLSNKEKKEVEEWAAGFNSMCEDVDEFELVVE